MKVKVSEAWKGFHTQHELELEVEAQCDFRVNTCTVTRQWKFLYSDNWNIEDDILYVMVNHCKKYAGFILSFDSFL